MKGFLQASLILWLSLYFLGFYSGIYFPKLGIEIFEKRISTHTDRPIVLIENNKVQLLNDQAEIRGIRKGNNIATAYSLVTNLMHFEKDHSEEQIQLKKIAALAYSCLLYTSDAADE